MTGKEEFKHLVRIANTDLDGNASLSKALTKIKGVGFMYSNMICSLTGIEKNKKAGNLAEEDIKKIESALTSPSKFNVPEWMLNRRKDVEDGTSKHLVSGNLLFTHENDIKMLKKIRCYRGVRHTSGLPVRGQRTKSNFRRNKGKVSLGVKVKPGAKPGKV
jgi:small subunit ribosomal protein S13